MQTKEEHYQAMIQAVQRYTPSADMDVIEAAYRYADEKHKNQLRKSGEPYIIHPLAVPALLAASGRAPDALPAAQRQPRPRRRRCGSLTGTRPFVARGLAPQEQAAIALLLRRAEGAVLCSPEQVAEHIKMGSNELGTGTDQRNHRGGRV